MIFQSIFIFPSFSPSFVIWKYYCIIIVQQMKTYAYQFTFFQYYCLIWHRYFHFVSSSQFHPTLKHVCLTFFLYICLSFFSLLSIYILCFTHRSNRSMMISDNHPCHLWMLDAHTIATSKDVCYVYYNFFPLRKCLIVSRMCDSWKLFRLYQPITLTMMMCFFHSHTTHMVIRQ